MGKTETLKYFSRCILEKHPKKTIVFKDLNDYKHQIQEMKNASMVTEVMFTEIDKKDLSGVIVLLDSYDVINPMHKEKVLDLIDKIVTMNADRIFIGSQIHREYELYNYSNNLFQLEPLSKEHHESPFLEKMDKEIVMPTPYFIEEIKKLKSKHHTQALIRVLAEMFEYYFVQFFIKIHNIEIESDLAQAELRNHYQNTCYKLCLFSVDDENLYEILEPGDYDEIISMKMGSDLIKDLINFAPDLNHFVFRKFFLSDLMFRTFKRSHSSKDMTNFWKFFESYFEEDILVYFFLHRLFYNIPAQIEGNTKKLSALITKICSKNKKINESFLEKMLVEYKIKKPTITNITKKRKGDDSEKNDRSPKRKLTWTHTRQPYHFRDRCGTGKEKRESRPERVKKSPEKYSDYMLLSPRFSPNRTKVL